MKPAYATISYAYATSAVATQFGCEEEGCWYYHAMTSAFDAKAGTERGPYATPSQALTALHKAYPTTPIPPGHLDWVNAQISL